MVHNPEKLEMATYYRKQGFSYAEIAKLCEVSKSTVSNWFKDKAFSKKITAANAAKAAKDNKARISLLNKAKQTARDKQYLVARKSAEVEFKHYKKDPLFAAGVMLYLSAGDTTDTQRIRLASAKTALHKVFHHFLQRYLGVEKSQIKFWLLLHQEHDEQACVAAWSKALKLPAEHFYKTQVIKGAPPQRTLHSGVGNTIIGSTVLKLKLNRWIELMTKELAK